jgi:hypothetical protein
MHKVALGLPSAIAAGLCGLPFLLLKQPCGDFLNNIALTLSSDLHH